ncbi:MAG: gene transfer agent family protein [Pseudomonadota bacterium]|nr:gene transfer agent family protein [Pseudomonadota bacterium]
MGAHKERRALAANLRRGEIAAMIDGTPRRLCLTLGSLAELEEAFAASDLAALTTRFSTGRLSARDLMVVIAAGLSGAGERTEAEEVAAMRFERGVAGAAEIAAKLLEAAFGGGEATGEASQGRPANPSRP